MKKRSLPPGPVYILRSDKISSVNSIFFNGNDSLIAGTLSGSVCFWDLQTNRIALQFEVSSNPVNSLHHTDTKLITQEKGGDIKLWNIAGSKYELVKAIKASHISFCHSDLVDSETLIYPDKENTIVALDLKNYDTTTRLFNPPDGHSLGSVTSLKSIIIREQAYIIAGYENGNILTWDIRSSKVMDTSKVAENPLAIDYDSLMNRGIIGGPENNLIPFEYNDSMHLIRLNADLQITNPGINCIRIRPDKKILSTGGWDSRIRIFSWKTLRPLAVLTEHKSGGIMDICYSKGKVFMWNAEIMAAAGMDGQISLWNIYN